MDFQAWVAVVVLLWALWLGAVVDWLTTDVVDVRTLPKGGWGLTLLFFWVLGAIAWFAWGHAWHPTQGRRLPGAWLGKG